MRTLRFLRNTQFAEGSNLVSEYMIEERVIENIGGMRRDMEHWLHIEVERTLNGHAADVAGVVEREGGYVSDALKEKVERACGEAEQALHEKIERECRVLRFELEAMLREAQLDGPRGLRA